MPERSKKGNKYDINNNNSNEKGSLEILERLLCILKFTKVIDHNLRVAVIYIFKFINQFVVNNQ